MKWRCGDIGSSYFDGYASPTEKLELARICGETGGLPFTGVDLFFWVAVAILIILAGVVFRKASG